MLNILFEQPMTIALIGAILTGLAFYAWVQSNHKGLLILGCVVPIATIAALIVERAVETDSESLKRLVETLAIDVKSNNIDRVVRHVSPSRQEVIEQAQSELPRHVFKKVNITKFHDVKTHLGSNPPTADIEFNVSVSGEFDRGALGEMNIMRFVKLKVQREADGEWRIVEYEHKEPQAFMFESESEKKLN